MTANALTCTYVLDVEANTTPSKGANHGRSRMFGISNQSSHKVSLCVQLVCLLPLCMWLKCDEVCFSTSGCSKDDGCF